MWSRYKEKIKKISIYEYLNELLKDGRSACISCGYIIEDIPGEQHDLYEGYGCPKCHSPFVMKKATGNERRF